MGNPTHLSKLKESYSAFTNFLKEKRQDNPEFKIDWKTFQYGELPYEELNQGTESWNNWVKQEKEQNPNFYVELSALKIEEASLSGMDLSGANLTGTEFVDSYMHGINLEETRLHGSVFHNCELGQGEFKDAEADKASFTKSVLYKCNFENAWIQNSNFRESKGRQVKFQNAKLAYADMSDISLMEADFSGAHLYSASFENTNLNSASFGTCRAEKVHFKNADLTNVQFHFANLTEADFQGANLQKTNFSEAVLNHANFTEANLSYTKNLLFSDNAINGAVITSTTNSPWLTLKKNYTNTMMIFHVLGVIAFFLPYLVNATIWRSLNLAQELNLVEVMNGQVVSTKCFAESCTPWHIWELLLGVRRSWFYATLSIVLIAYNACRIFLTQRLGVLRDFEQATGYTPPYQGSMSLLRYKFRQGEGIFHGYRYLYVIHNILQFILVIAIISALFHFGTWLVDIVELPTK